MEIAGSFQILQVTLPHLTKRDVSRMSRAFVKEFQPSPAGTNRAVSPWPIRMLFLVLMQKLWKVGLLAFAGGAFLALTIIEIPVIFLAFKNYHSSFLPCYIIIITWLTHNVQYIVY